MAKLEDLIRLILEDVAFAQRLLDEPEATLRSAGFNPTEEQLAAVAGLDLDGLRTLASSFDGNKAAAF